ncbi:MAG: metallophosphoesterase [Oscillospiraceae bacterium]|nr:metallophosphoesterase [Oscillospiraceae bacterium]
MAISRRKASFEIRPAVCAAGENYMICIPTDGDMLMSVFVDGEEYTYDNCGVKVSTCYVQKFVIPMSALNSAKKYTVVYERIKREAYCSEKEPPVKKDFSFYPIEKEDGINIYHLSDVHGRRVSGIKAGKYFDENLDILILNGDISSSSQTAKETLLPLDMAFEITKGERPCVITRGNHDLRGVFAEKIHEFYPLDNGRFYYTVKLGPVWIMVLDCGEDKNDDNHEYAGTIAFHKYRKKETEFIRSLCDSRDNPIENEEKYKIVVSHIPFSHRNYKPDAVLNEFDIESETYGEWVRLINEKIKPSFGLFGHVHNTVVSIGDGARYNDRNLNCPLVLGGRPLTNDVIGCAITLSGSGADIAFSNSRHKVIGNEHIELNL